MLPFLSVFTDFFSVYFIAALCLHVLCFIVGTGMLDTY